MTSVVCDACDGWSAPVGGRFSPEKGGEEEERKRYMAMVLVVVDRGSEAAVDLLCRRKWREEEDGMAAAGGGEERGRWRGRLGGERLALHLRQREEERRRCS